MSSRKCTSERRQLSGMRFAISSPFLKKTPQPPKSPYDGISGRGHFNISTLDLQLRACPFLLVLPGGPTRHRHAHLLLARQGSRNPAAFHFYTEQNLCQTTPDAILQGHAMLELNGEASPSDKLSI